jgi:hypothetical protein
MVTLVITGNEGPKRKHLDIDIRFGSKILQEGDITFTKY